MDVLGLLSGIGDGLKAAMLVCIVWVLLYRSDHVRNVALFRAACWLYALSLLIPTLVSLYLTATTKSTAGGPGVLDPSTAAMRVYLGSIAPILFAVSLLVLTDSIMPRRPKSRAEPAAAADGGSM